MPEDRPIIVSGADHKVSVELPDSTEPKGGSHNVQAAGGPFKTIVFTRGDEVEFRTRASGNWKITIE